MSMIEGKLPGSSPHSIRAATAKNRASARPRIGIITSTFPFLKGEEFLRAELAALAESGCELTLFPAAPRSNRNNLRDLDVELVRFPVLAPITLYRAFHGLRLNVRGAYRALMTILGSRNSLRPKLKNLALFPTGLAVADQVRMRRLDHIHAHWLTGPATVALIASHVTGVPWSYTAHSGDIFWEDNLIAEKVVSANFGRVISEYGRQGIIRRSSDAASARLEVLHMGVAIPDRAAIIGSESRLGRLRMLCPAYLESWKGHTYLLDALRRVIDAGVDVECVFAGDGPLRTQLTRQRSKLGLEKVVSMPGIIPHETLLQQLYSGAYDVVVLSSIDLEGIPVALMEAMAAGIPCIATRTGAIPELIDDSCGILVNRRDSQAMSEAIVALTSDPDRRKEISARARSRVSEEFNARGTAQALLELITDAQLRQD